MRFSPWAISTFFILMTASAGLCAQFKLSAYVQMAFPGYNNAAIPASDGTRISLSRELDQKNIVISPRLEFSYLLKKRHYFGLMASLLRLESDGQIDRDVSFEGESFPANTPLESVYRFNSYRFTYRYRVIDHPKIKLELGVTAKVRDAMISLSGNGTKTAFYNVGFAPLLSYYVEWIPIEALSIYSYGDAFGVSVGRAEDIFAGLKYNLSPTVSILGGYRLLEGGSNGDKAYTFALFHYAAIGAEVRF